MSNNSVHDNFSKARDWAKNNHKNNPSGKPPINWFLVIVFVVIVAILFFIYIKYYAIWGSTSPSVSSSTNPGAISMPSVPSNSPSPSAMSMNSKPAVTPIVRPVFEVAPDGTTYSKSALN